MIAAFAGYFHLYFYKADSSAIFFFVITLRKWGWVVESGLEMNRKKLCIF